MPYLTETEYSNMMAELEKYETLRFDRRDTIAAQAETIRELREALKPFAKLANKSTRAFDEKYCAYWCITDETKTTYGDDGEVITYGHIRNAARALKETEPK